MKKWVRKTGGIILSAAMVLGAAGALPEGTQNGLCIEADAAASYKVIDGILVSATGVSGDVVIPGNMGIKAIKASLFSGNSAITSVVFPEGLEIIAGSAFYSCYNLKSIKFPSSLVSIGQSAFSGCTGLTSLNLPEGMTELAESSFEGCTGLKTVTIPSTVGVIGRKAFYQCTGITGATIQEGTSTIKNSAFQRCSNLKTLKIPVSVTLIGSGALSQTGLTDIYYGGSETSWNSITKENFNLPNVTVHYTGSVQTPIDSLAAIPAQTYTGSALTPALTVKAGSTVLTSGKDYTAVFSGNVNAGTATVTVTGKGSYTGTLNGSFTISPKNVSSCTIDAISDQTYTGSALTPDVTVRDGSRTLTKGTDYTVSYSSNINVGTATVTVTGKGNYTGTNGGSFRIVNRTVDFTVYDIAAQTYTGSALTPDVIVKDGNKTLTKGTDYTVSYSNNVNVGTANVTVKGTGSYAGVSKNSEFVINARSASNFTISEIADQTYTGSAITPAVTVTDGNKVLTKGTDYTVSYTNNINIGKATVTITGKGNYTDSKSVDFTIKAMPVKTPTVTDVPGDGEVTLSWDAVKDAEKYAAYIVNEDDSLTLINSKIADTSYTVTKLTNGTLYRFLVRAYGNDQWSKYSSDDFVECRPVNIKPSVRATPGDCEVTLAWDVVKDAEKYAAYIVNEDDSLTLLYSKITGTSYTATKLTGGKTYRFLVRAYVGGKWSAYTKTDYVKVTLANYRPVITATPGDKQVVLTWGAIDDAEKYAAYIVNADNSLTLLNGKIAGTSYTAAKLTNGQTYKFLVRAYVNGKWSKYEKSDCVKATPVSSAVKPDVQAEPADQQVTLTWEAMEGATKYAAYIVNADDSLTLLSGKIETTEYTAKKLTNHTEYKFLVRACIDGKWTKYDESDYVACTPAALKPLVRASCYDSMITLRWGAVDNAERYAAYIVNDDDTVTLLAGKITKVKYNVKNLTNDKEYRFLVRARIDGKWTEYTKKDIISATPKA